MALNLQIRSLDNLEEIGRAVSAWLAARPASEGSRVGLNALRHIDGSGSTAETLTASLTVANAGCVSSEAVVLRVLAPELSPYLDTRLERQVAVTRWVETHTTAPIPVIIDADTTGTVLGRPFLLMKLIKGDAPADYPGYNLSGFLTELKPEGRRRLWESAMESLSAIHNADVASLDFLDFPGTTSAHLPDLLNHWQASYQWCGEDIADPFFEGVLAWLRRDLPTDAPRGLSWGDARMGNMLFRRERCVAVLDWEMASLGGPLVDLAWWLLFDRIQDEDIGAMRLEGLGDRSETIALWELRTGLSADRLHWHEVLACFQLAVTRAKSFGARRRAGKPVPSDDDPRSVLRLRRRLEALLG